MKIESNGFRVTEICPQIERIEVDGEGTIRMTVRTHENAVPVRSAYMNIDEFSAFVEAAKTALARAIEESGAMG